MIHELLKHSNFPINVFHKGGHFERLLFKEINTNHQHRVQDLGDFEIMEYFDDTAVVRDIIMMD